MSSFRDGARKGVKLLIAIWGDSGSGKTRSGLAVARGIAAHAGEDFSDPETLRRVDQRIWVIDTDAGRAEHYCPPEGEPPRVDRFAIKHADFDAPFTSERLLALCNEAVAGGAEVVLVDSMSSLWDGEGGCADWHARLVAEAVERARKQYNARESNRYPFDEDYEANRASVGAWKAPHDSKQAWLDLQGEDLAALRARGPALVSRLEALVRESAASADGDAPAHGGPGGGRVASGGGDF